MRAPRPRTLPAVIVLAALSACSDDSSPSGPGGGSSGYKTPEEVIAAHAQAWEARDIDAYTRLLESPPDGARTTAGFRYYPLISDLDHFPWMTGESWDFAEEVGMVGHMMDSTFVSPVVHDAVDFIQADFEILGTEPGPEGTRVSTHAVMTVLWGPQSGARSDERFEFLLVADADGFLRIREIRENRLFIRSEEARWGMVKALFR